MKLFDALSKPFGWAGKWSRIMDPASVSELDDRVFGGRIQDRTQGVPWYKTASDPGSLMFGRADQRNSLGMERQGNKSGFFGDKAQGIDWAGSPITAGTNWQGAARLGALLYGAVAGGGALAGAGGGGAAAGEGAGSGAVVGGAGGATAGSGMAAGSSGAEGGGGAAGGAAGGTTSGGAASTGGGWQQYLRQGGMPQQRQAQTYQPNMTMLDDGTQVDPKLLAMLLRQA